MNKALFTILSLMFVSALGASYYIFYDKKSYDFLVEAPCDPTSQICYVRDCQGPDGCPPNNLSEYQVFKIKAADFSGCKDNSCLSECKSGSISCAVVACDESAGDVCSASI
ncbi:MAG TPA: hypothetical protein VFQ72_00315 [Candidatus Paceibacterota bacterium]|nr:hypothetical protein [Candidatus Paceibacterota bacterium]